MTISFDAAADFPAVIDGTETVLLHRGQGAGVSVAGALRRDHDVGQLADSGGRVSAAETRWHLPLFVLSDPPEVGDRIVDAAAAVWTIVEVRHEEASGRWVCLAKEVAMIHGLTERVDIERAVWTKDAAGAPRATWHLWRAGLRARIQPIEAVAATTDGREHLAATHRVLLAEPLSVDQDCRVVGPGGRVYRMVAHHPATQIEALNVLDVACDAPAVDSEGPA